MDVDINAVDQRAHMLNIVSTVCRYAVLAVAVVTCALTYCCDSEAWTRRVEAQAAGDRLTSEWKGVAVECQRWSP